MTPPSPASVAIVTGASSGIGRGFARALSARGWRVVAAARREEPLVALADEAKRAGDAEILPLAIDVTAPDAPARLLDVAGRLGPLGWLVNNAGVVTLGRFEDSDAEAERALLRLNCEALVMLTRAALPPLIRAGAGIVVNVASAAGFQPTPGWATYGASKAFVISFSEALFDELRGTGVSTTAVCPGPVATEIFGEHERRRRPPPHELTVEQCVNTALSAALRGRAVVIPGRMNALVALGSKLAPRSLVRWISGRTSLRALGLPPLRKRD